MKISSKLIVIFIILFITGVTAGVAFLIKPAIGPGPTTKEPQEFKNVILIGWDGARRDVLHRLLKEERLPNLSQLIKKGAIVDIDILDAATETKPGWAEILTGYKSKSLGIQTNLDYKPIPKGYTIFERLGDHFGKENIVTVFLGGKLNNIGARGPHKICVNCLSRYPGTFEKTEWWDQATNAPTYSGEQRVFEEREGEPFYNLQGSIDLFLNGIGGAQNVGGKAQSVLQQYKDRRFFMFFHFEEPDEPGHKFGEGSREYDEGIITNDHWLGVITAQLRGFGLYEKTLVYVVSDHGFDKGERSHRNAPEIFLATNDPKVKRAGTRIDITPTILDRYGINLGRISPRLHGKSLLDKSK